MIYYNAPNYNPNLVFESEHNANAKHHTHLHENPVYRLSTKYQANNYIELNILNERKGKNNKIQSEVVIDVNMLIKFSKTKAKITISDKNENSFSIPSIFV
jgi:hypothetical protein